MKILYGVQTTGRGHLVRARAMIAGLKARGHRVETLFSGPPVEPVWLDDVFEPWSRREGLTHVSIDGRISYLATARRLRPLRFLRDVRRFDAGDADLVISDYEPISARVARRAGIESIGIGHLFAFAHHPVPVAGRNLFNQAIMRGFAPVDVPLGLHWHAFGRPILPPTIPADVAEPGEATHDGPVLVYASFESLDAVVRVLTALGRPEFRVYARVAAPRRVANVQVLPIARAAFVADLARTSGVICNAGFSLISEALHLGKRVLAKPVRHQTEQESNAKALELLGLGTVCRRLEPAAITAWLRRPAPAPMGYPDVLTAVLDWIDAGRPDSLQTLADSLWSRTAPAQTSPVQTSPAQARAGGSRAEDTASG